MTKPWQSVANSPEEKRFFHWELAFPDVFCEPGSGFDAVIGNPPWDIAKPNSKEFFSNHDPLYRGYGKKEALDHQKKYFKNEDIEFAWLDYQAGLKSGVHYFKYRAKPSGSPEDYEKSVDRFSLGRGKANQALHHQWAEERAKSRGYADTAHPFTYQGSADVNLYKLFLELSHSLLRQEGRLGMIVPSGVYSDSGTRALRELFVNKSRWEWLFGFENRKKIFDIHRSFKFNPVIVQKGGQTSTIQTSFMRHDLEDWENGETYSISYSREQIQKLSPHSNSVLEVKSEADLIILTKIYKDSDLIGNAEVEFYREFHMTDDAKLFPPRKQWEENGYIPDEYSRWVSGRWAPISDIPIKQSKKENCSTERKLFPEGVILSRDQKSWISEGEIEDVALPLYQGRMIWQFDPSYQVWEGPGPEDWIPNGNPIFGGKFLLNYTQKPLLRIGYRAVQNASNQRTLIASFIGDLPAGNAVSLLELQQPTKTKLFSFLAQLNSFSVDRALRLKMSQNNVNWFYLSELPIKKLSQSLEELIATLSIRLTCTLPILIPSLLRIGLNQEDYKHRFLTKRSRIEARAKIDAVLFIAHGFDFETASSLLVNCDYPIELINKMSPRWDTKGFWRVDRNSNPELRSTVLTLIALSDLQKLIEKFDDQEIGIERFLNENNGDGWMVPETVCLADYGLGHDERALHPQPVASELGPRFHDWQLAQTSEESWRECLLHARNLLGKADHEMLLREIDTPVFDQSVIHSPPSESPTPVTSPSAETTNPSQTEPRLVQGDLFD